jgi:hypothetical protein
MDSRPVQAATHERTMGVAMITFWMLGVAGEIRSAEMGVNCGTGRQTDNAQ